MMNRHESWGTDDSAAQEEANDNVSDILQSLLQEEVSNYNATTDESSSTRTNNNNQKEESSRVDKTDSNNTSHRKTQSLWEIPTGGPKHRGRHHRHKSSISELFTSMGSGLESIAENVMSEARVVRESWQTEMRDAQSGKTFFLDMNLTRSLSILPEDLPLVVEETTGLHVSSFYKQGEEPSPPPPPPPPLVTYGPYLALLGAVLAVSSNGGALSLLHGVPAPLKLYWRMTATAMVLFPFASRAMFKLGGLPALTFSQWLTFLGAVIGYTGNGLLYIYALQYTSIGNVVIGANSQAILLILGKLIMGQQVVFMEGGGVLVAFIGCIFCSSDEAKDPDNSSSASSLAVVGDLLALGSGAFGVGYLTFAKAVRKDMPVTVFMFLVMVCGSLFILTFMIITDGVDDDLSLSRDPFFGLFGWMTVHENRLYILIHIAVVCNVIGAMGFVRAMQYFDNIVIAVATLLEPMIATLIAVAIGVGQLPGTMGWIGNLLVVVGTLGVVYPSIDKPMAH